MKKFELGEFYTYNNTPHIRRSVGATKESKFECVAVGDRWALMYFDGRKCGQKETTVAVEHGDGLWKQA